MQERARFAQLYAQLPDDELAELALSGELVVEAQEALAAELDARGLKDLSQFKKTRCDDAAVVEDDRQRRLGRSLKVLHWGNLACYAVSFALCGFGAFQLAFPQWKLARDDDGLLVAVGVGLVILTWIESKLSKIWYRKVLFRKSPRQLALERQSSSASLRRASVSPSKSE